MKLKGKTALVTGGGRGIGRAIALGLAEEGAQVAVLDILTDNAESVRREIEALGVKALALGADLTRRAQVTLAVEEILGQWGQIDILVNNAGWDKLEPFLESEEETWDRIIGINFKAILYVCKAVLPHMVARGTGKVISIASDAGRAGSMGEAVYAGTKGAIIAFSKTMARELARWRITVNVVCPGPTDTALFRDFAGEGERGEKLKAALTRAIPFGRLGRPEDIPGAVLFLASDDAAFITGQVLSVSGGLTMAG